MISFQSNNEFNFISFHDIGRTMNCACIWSQYWLRDVQTTTVACRASFLISCLHDQPRSTAINHDQHGRSGGVTLYDQQLSRTLHVDQARGWHRTGGCRVYIVDSIFISIFLDILVELKNTVSEANIQMTPLLWTRCEVDIERRKMRIEEFCEKLITLQCDWLRRSSTGKI